jgi:hypothetical protein
METPSLQSLIGQEIHALIPLLDPKIMQRIKLHAVEVGGIWIECEKFTQDMLQATQMSASKTPLLFLPYSQITFVLFGDEQIALSESSFGVKD